MSISAHYISDFLSQNKTISLEKIGTITLSDPATSGEEDDITPPQIFTYDKKAETTTAFIEYLAQQTQKSLSIVQSDFEYFLDQSRQLMNIGSTPLVINGIGYIYAEKNGEYAFTTEHLQEVKEKQPQEDVYNNSPLTSATNYASRRMQKRSIGRWILILLIIGVIVYGAYFIPKSSFSFLADNQDSATHTQAKTSTVQAPPVKEKDTIVRKEGEYKFVFQTFDLLSNAEKRVSQLKSYGNIVQMDSSSLNGISQYKLYIQMQNIQPTDTVRIKDSLRSYYGHPVKIE